MGCDNTKEKQHDSTYNTQAKTASGAEEFSILATKNSLAAKLKEEWSYFVRFLSPSTPSETRKEVWVNTANDPITHRSADEIGKLFLVYLRNDLALREWSGNFNYTVVGLEKQGFLKATATVDANIGSGRTKDALWDVKMHYHSTSKRS